MSSDLNFQKIKINFLDEEFNFIIDNEDNFRDSFKELKKISESLKENAPFMTNSQILFTASLKIIEDYKNLNNEFLKLNENSLSNNQYNESLIRIENFAFYFYPNEYLNKLNNKIFLSNNSNLSEISLNSFTFILNVSLTYETRLFWQNNFDFNLE